MVVTNCYKAKNPLALSAHRAIVLALTLEMDMIADLPLEPWYTYVDEEPIDRHVDLLMEGSAELDAVRDELAEEWLHEIVDQYDLARIVFAGKLDAEGSAKLAVWSENFRAMVREKLLDQAWERK